VATPQWVGAAGEEAAVAHLRARGLRLVARDWRCRLGQLDIVCEEAGVLVAVEVKARRGVGFGLPQEAVDRRKQAKLRLLLEAYRQASGRGDQPCRIDVVAVRLDRELRLLSCEHIRDAVAG
jgi:putative endonuclease